MWLLLLEVWKNTEGLDLYIFDISNLTPVHKIGFF